MDNHNLDNLAQSTLSISKLACSVANCDKLPDGICKTHIKLRSAVFFYTLKLFTIRSSNMAGWKMDDLWMMFQSLETSIHV